MCPHTGVLIYLHILNKIQADIKNKDDGHNILTNRYNKTWQVNTQLIDNLKNIYILTTSLKAVSLLGKQAIQLTAEVHHHISLLVCMNIML